MTLPVELFLAFTLAAVACERCGAAVREDETVCGECSEALDESWACDGVTDDGHAEDIAGGRLN